MSTAYYLTTVAHVLAALFWLGGMFFLGVVGAPVLRRVEPAALRQRLFHEIGVRFRAAGWWAVAVLVATGVALLHLRGFLRWSGVWGEPAFWDTPVGRALAAKLLAVGAMLVASVVHDVVLGPAASRAPATSPEASALRRRAAVLARVNALVGIGVVMAAVRLARA